jgi:hypothetical protein
MARSMVHPYWGTLVVCAQLRPRSHFERFPTHDLRSEMCDHCGALLWSCVQCGRYVECCPCGEHHADECPWPL